jgi:hypothetical protein
VAGVDGGNNVGDFSPAMQIGAAKQLRLAVTGNPVRGRSTRVSLTVTGPAGGVGRATVRASGAGMRRQAVRTNSMGKARLSVRPKRRGTITFRATKSGYQPAAVTKRVR